MADDTPPVTQTAEDRAAILLLAYEQGLRGLDGQDAMLGSIRQSGATIAALNGLTAAFLGRQVLENREALVDCAAPALGTSAWIAMLALVASVICVVQLFRPRDGWMLHFEPRSVMNQFAFGPKATTLARTHEVLAGFAEDNYNANEKNLEVLFRWLIAAGLLFCVQVCSWLVALV